MRKPNKKILIAMVIIFGTITVISKIAYGMTVIQVQTESVKQASLDKSLVYDGKIIQENTNLVRKVNSQIVKSVHVRVGDSVAEGDSLYTIDIGRLDEIIKEKQNENDKMQASIDEANKKKELAVSEKNIGVKRANDDYEIAKNDGQRLADIAYREYVKAVERYKEYMNAPEKFPELTMSDLENAVASTEKSYNEVLAETQKKLLEASRAIEDANRKSISETNVQDFAIQKSAIGDQLQKLINIKNEGATIKAANAGIVVEINVKTGEIMDEGAALFIADISLPNQVEVILETALGQKINTETKVSLKGKSKVGEKVKIEGLKVDEMAEDGNGNTRIVIETATNDWVYGQMLEVTFENKSNVYNKCIPISAVQMEESNHFIYVIETQESIMGIEKIAKRIEVDLIDMGNEYVAIESGEITDDTKIIINSKKTIKNGNRVRMVDEL